MRHSHQYFFLHIRKTAGTSFRHMLREIFPSEGDVIPNAKDFKKQQGHYLNMADFVCFPPHRLQNCRLLCGHLPSITRDLFASPPKLLLFLRDPVPRTISNLLHIQRHKYPSWSLSKLLTNNEVMAHVTNSQTRMLSFHSVEEARVYEKTMIPDRNRLELAKRVLESSDFLGLTEEFEQSIGLCERTFNWKFKRGVVNFNQTPISNEDYESTIERIRPEVELDQELYEFGRDLFYRRLTMLK